MFERLGRRLTRSVLIWDVGITLLCLYFASGIRLRLGFGSTISAEQVQLPWKLYLLVAAIWTIIFLILTPHRTLFISTFLDAIGRLVVAVCLASLTFAGLLYLFSRDISRLQFVYFAIGNFVALLISHLVIYSYTQFHNSGRRDRRVLLVGDGLAGLEIARQFARRPWAGIHIIGCTSDEAATSDVAVLGPIDATARVVSDYKIDEVIFVIQQQHRIAHVSLQLQEQPVMLHMVPGILDLAFSRTPVETLGGIPLISLRESALSESQRMLKRLFDVATSAFLLLLLSPLMIVIAILITMESPGPVFFLQERIGEHGQRFKMIKFRSMYRDAEQRWLEVALRHANGELHHKITNDPRVTAVGRKLRRTSLDELPQLINVLRGEMSLVGPRPEMPYIAAEYQPWQWYRFRVLPGITGWWQVNGRSERPMHLHTEDDLYYIHNYSFWLDLRILWMTIRVVLSGHGAF